MSASFSWQEFIVNLFARKAFTANLLERSFRQPMGWVELAIMLALVFVAYRLSEKWAQSSKIKAIRFRMIRHVLRRVLFPVLLLVVAIIAQVAWEAAGLHAVWLKLLLLAANWMMAIRLVLALINGAFPKSTRSDAIERAASTGLWGCFILWLSGIDDWIIDWLKSLQIPIGASKLNVYTILSGLLWVGVMMVGTMWFYRWLNARLMASARLDMNLRIVLSKVMKSLLMILSVLVALPLVGIDLTVLSVFGGALGVGLGFGLQKIASNYVSGFIILADRSIRINDRLTVNGFTGYVTQLTSRFVVLRNANGAEALIPNETFVTNTVINESYTARALYQSLDIQVAYATDLTLAMNILREAAAEQKRVGTNPPPSALLLGFGDNGINLRVGFWVNDPENGFGGLFSDILLTIWQRFNEEGIELPFPQREVRILNNDNDKRQPENNEAA